MDSPENTRGYRDLHEHLAELERRRRGATAELVGKQAAAVAAVASSALGFWWVVPKLLAV